MRDLSLIFKALSDETRLSILALLLKHRELCVCDFEHVLEITQSKSSRHLRYLLNAGLVQDRREAVWVHYRISEALGSERQIILDALEPLLTGERLEELEARLIQWQEMKPRDGVKCRDAAAGKAEPRSRGDRS